MDDEKKKKVENRTVKNNISLSRPMDLPISLLNCEKKTFKPKCGLKHPIKRREYLFVLFNFRTIKEFKSFHENDLTSNNERISLYD